MPAYNPAEMSGVGQGLPDADFVFLAAEMAQEALQGIQQIRAAGITTPIVGGDGYDSEDIWEAHPEIQNVFYTTHVYLGPDHPSKLIQNFRKAYRQAYGGNLPDAFAALGYDAVNLLAKAIIAAGDPDPVKVRRALGQLDSVPGVTGVVSYRNDNQVPHKSVSIIAINDGKRIFREELRPEVIP